MRYTSSTRNRGYNCGDGDRVYDRIKYYKELETLTINLRHNWKLNIHPEEEDDIGFEFYAR